MKTKETRKAAMTTGQIISSAKRNGYYQSKGAPRLVCPDCNFKSVLVLQGPKKNEKIKYDKIYACPCGWRRVFLKEQKSVVTKRVCKVEGCNAILPAERKAYCYRCRPYKPKEAKKESGAGPKNSNVVM